MGAATRIAYAAQPADAGSGVFRVVAPVCAEGAAAGARVQAARYVEAGPAMTDHESLIARAAAGDEVAFREVYVRHRSDVARVVYRMMGSRPDTDDVIQEVFFQLFRSLKDFRGQAKFTTWLHRVTVNVVLMHRRAARSRPVYTDEPPQDATPDTRQALPDEEAGRYERMRAFRRLLDRLAEKKRIVFILHELEGMAPAEIAKVVDAPILTVRTRLFYARRELEAMLCEEPSLAGVAQELAEESARSVAEPPVLLETVASTRGNTDGASVPESGKDS